MLSRGAVIALALLVLAACETTVAPRQFPEITFRHLSPIRLDVAKITYAPRYRAPVGTPNVGQEFPTPPVVAAERWIADRLVAVGASGEAIVSIRRATATETRLKVKKGVTGAFTTDQAWRYDGYIEMSIKAVDLNGQRSATATAAARQSQTVPEDASLDGREAVWFGLVEKLMRRFDSAFAAQIRKDLTGFVK
ncbi:MAG: hypothetical protein CFH40_00734 [Alphaproteobacteria bacterium MarineAlpha10_Bin3]|nr:MAG: hypothetical protein CFH40_00734 [Alphaproteobacteria bacterium MarineAlpha10_Bin3]PPR73648.1 MAG: hypothetical protein CFH09_00734 [Alphaproteobacteria bacterium MarineAlpha4_Bin1]